MNRLLITLIGIVMFQLVFAQSPNPFNPKNVTPVTPEVAALGKYVDIPIGYSSGTADISIPIFKITSGAIEVPVSMSYNTSGIKVEEASTWVGLGWNLNTGGNISRVVRGLPDDLGSGLMNVASNRKVSYILNMSQSDRDNVITQEVAKGYIDVEPDLFVYNLMGYTGKFYWSQDSSKFVQTPYTNVKIEFNGNQFILTLPNGVKGYFGVSYDGLRNSREFMNDQQTTFMASGMANYPPYYNVNAHISSWSLLDIKDLSDKLISYYYTSVEAKNFGRAGEATDLKGPYDCDAADNDNKASFFTQTVYKPVLQKISGEQFDLHFILASTVRDDVFINEKALDSIHVKTKTGSIYKSYYLDKGYFTSTGYTTLWGLEAYAQIARKRLYLKSIKEIFDGNALPPYEFTYSSVQLPDRLSSAQDYWGYYNGKNSSTVYLTPKLKAKHLFGSGDNIYNTWGADRRIDTNFHKAGALIKVKYPTGGTTEYTYETNKASLAYFKEQSGIERSELHEKTFISPKPSFSYPVGVNDPEPYEFIDTFTVADVVGYSRINAQLGGCPYGYQDASCRFIVTIRSLTSQSFQSITIDMSGERWPLLPQGQYEIKTVVSGSPDPVPAWSFTIDWKEQPDPYSFWVGGLRIKKVVSRPNHGTAISKSIVYEDFDTAGKSSGFVQSLPSHISLKNCIWQEQNQVEASLGIYNTYYSYCYRSSSTSQLPLGSDGQSVRYLSVTEFYDTLNTSFKTEFSFSNDFLFYNSPPPAFSYDRPWRNNHLTKKKVFEKASSGYRPLQEERRFYKSHRDVQSKSFGFHFESYPVLRIPGSLMAEANEPHGIYWDYHYASDWYLLDSIQTISYAYSSSGTSTSETNTKQLYNDFMHPHLVVTKNSKGQTSESRTWYTTDFDQTVGYNVGDLYQKRFLEAPLKVEQSINGKLVNGNVVTYSYDGLPVHSYLYENYNELSTPVHSRTSLINSSYVLKNTVIYDSQRNLIQSEDPSAGNTSYVWEYISTGSAGVALPVAVVKNADASDIAYTSFENGSFGNLSITGSVSNYTNAITGERAYTITGANSLSISGIDAAKTYTLSYWGTNSFTVSGSSAVQPGMTVNGLTFYSHKIVNPSNGTIQLTGNGTIDEVLLTPEKSEGNTFTYNGYYQIATTSDKKGTVKYYEYDSYRRLGLIRDVNDNILKKFCYNYSSQPENCGLGTEAQWQVVDIYCQQSNGINTGNEIILEKDTNPNSSTYGNTNTITISNSPNCYVCTTTNCVGEGKKCINNNCETGVKVYTGTLRLNQSTIRCYYHYQWSDNTTSTTYYEDKSIFTPCY